MRELTKKLFRYCTVLTKYRRRPVGVQQFVREREKNLLSLKHILWEKATKSAHDPCLTYINHLKKLF